MVINILIGFASEAEIQGSARFGRPLDHHWRRRRLYLNLLQFVISNETFGTFQAADTRVHAFWWEGDLIDVSHGTCEVQ
jgi:hypothetical protein